MKRKKTLIVCMLVLIVLLLPIPIEVRATTDGITSGQSTIMVNDEIFEIGGFATDWGRFYLCLSDMAYMLNGTSAQFNIRTPIDNRWDFWIIRGEAHTPTGMEFQYVPTEWWGLPSGYAGTDMINNIQQTAVIGIDGGNEPTTSLIIDTIQALDNTYFEIRSIASILGFDFFTFHGHNGFPSHEFDFPVGLTTAIMTETHVPMLLPVQSVELVRLMRSLTGLWVDIAHFDSPIVDERSVWPAELRITSNGINIPIRDSLAPMRPQWSSSLWEWEAFWHYPVSMHTLENGLVELTVNQPEQAQLAWNAMLMMAGMAREATYSLEDHEEFLNNIPQFYNYRIIVDSNQEQINSFTLYIGDVAHIMRRRGNTFEEFADFRYQVLPAEDGGIMLRYLFGPWSLSHREDREFRIYRSHEPIGHDTPRRIPHSDFINIEMGMELLFSQSEIDPTDRIVFEFIDNTAQPGNVYYYTLWNMHTDFAWNTREALHSNRWAVRVDVNEILGIPEPKVIEPIESPAPLQTPEPIEPQTPLENESRSWLALLPILIALITGAFVFYLLKRYKSNNFT